MPDLPHALTVALTAQPLVTYGTITLFTFIEGPVVMVVSGFLLKLGALSLRPLLLSLALGDLIGDTLWYWVGYHVVERALRTHGSYMGLTPARLKRIEARFRKHSSWLLFTSKATLGFGTSALTLPMLMTAGVMRYPFRKYILLNMLGECVLLTIFLSIGYFFGASYQGVSRDFRDIFLVGASILLVVGAMMLVRLNRQKGQEL